MMRSIIIKAWFYGSPEIFVRKNGHTDTLLSNRPVGAQVGHTGPVVNRIGLSINMEEEWIVCDP